MTDKTKIDALIILGILILPIYISNRGSPIITRKRALNVAKNERSRYVIFLEYFWQIQIILSIVLSSMVIMIINGWEYYSIENKALLLILSFVLLFSSGFLSSIPAMVMTNHWRKDGR